MNRFLLAVALFSASAIFVAGQTSPKLGIRLRSQRDSYSFRSDIEIEITRENTGDGRLLIPRQWGSGVMRTQIRVFDASGHEVKTDFFADELPPPPKPYDFVLLDPGQFVGMRLKERATDFVNKPGDYVFVVEYTSYLSEEYAREVMKMPDVPFWSRESGTVISNKVRLRITQ
ncbi:MAG: hypothetical protein LAP21_08715 [Acidobacteriia bacterium]|nr:hypothetical protein [Terriglobia bacterium]